MALEWGVLLKFWLWDWQFLAYYAALLVVFSLLLVLTVARFLNSQVTYCRNFTRLDGKVVVMTGGTKGIGLEAARQLLAKGCRLVLGCPDMAEGRRVAGQLEERLQGCGTVTVLPLELSSTASVRAFAGHLLRTEKRLDVLVLNHSVSASRRRECTDGEGFERTMATNYIGHFLLANLLFGLIKVTPHSRVLVTVSPIYNFLKTMNPDDLLFNKERYTPMRANALAAVCLMLFTRHFAVLASKYGVLVNCFSPGFVSADDYDPNVDLVSGRLRYWAGKLIGRTPLQGSQTLLFLALEGEAITGSGGYFVDCKSRVVSDLVARTGLAQKVFEATEDLVRLTRDERRYI